MTRLATILAVLLLAISAQAKELWLAWDYPEPYSNVMFEVWKSTDLKTWKPFFYTTLTRCRIDGRDPQAFFRVRARNYKTGEVSEWATT